MNGVSGNDDYHQNSVKKSKFDAPETVDGPFFVWFTTNNRASENSYRLIDASGEVLFERTNLQNTTQYKDTFDLAPGCYSLIVDGQGIPFKSDTIEKIYQLPLQYGQTYTGTGYTYIDLSPFSDLQFIQYRNRFSEVDGWGNLITPFGSFSVLRVKHEIIEEDSVYQSFVGTGSWFALPTRIIKEYEWWAKGEKEPILKIVTNEISGNETVQSVEYKDIYRGLDASTSAITNTSFDVYPNPAKGELFYESIIPIQKIQIKNLSGKILYNKELNNTFKGNIMISKLESGVYLMDIKTTKSWFKKRIIVR